MEASRSESGPPRPTTALCDLPELMTIAEVAPFLRMATSTAYAAIKRGEFPVPVLRVAGRMVISRYQIESWLGASRIDTPDASREVDAA